MQRPEQTNDKVTQDLSKYQTQWEIAGYFCIILSIITPIIIVIVGWMWHSKQTSARFVFYSVTVMFGYASLFFIYPTCFLAVHASTSVMVVLFSFVFDCDI